MRERAKLADLAKVGAAQLALQQGSQAMLARHAGEHRERENALALANDALDSHYSAWDALLNERALDPVLIRLQAASITNQQDLVAIAEQRLADASRRLDSSRIAYAQATVRMKSGWRRQRALRKRLARLSEEKRLTALEDRRPRERFTP